MAPVVAVAGWSWMTSRCALLRPLARAHEVVTTG